MLRTMLPFVRSSGTQSPETGMAIMVLAMFLVPAGDTLTKVLVAQMVPFEIAFWRFLIQAIVLGVAMLALGHSFRPAAPLPLLALGGLMSATTLLSLIGAFAVMPIATAIAIFFVEPLILTVLSALILKEATGWRRYAAVAVGLCGALVVIRPNWAAFGWPAALPLLGAFAFASNMIIIRRATRTMSGFSVQFWMTTFAVIALGIGLLGSQVLGLFPMAAFEAGASVWGLLMLMGALAALTFLLISEAFRRTPASVLAPFQYLEIIGATALGYLVFGDFPDALTWLGTAIILASGLYVFHRERQQGRAAAARAARQARRA